MWILNLEDVKDQYPFTFSQVEYVMILTVCSPLWLCG
jgi:hypothetical protein